eukprot:1235271-Rhodomonas_salina.3
MPSAPSDEEVIVLCSLPIKPYPVLENEKVAGVGFRKIRTRCSEARTSKSSTRHINLRITCATTMSSRSSCLGVIVDPLSQTTGSAFLRSSTRRMRSRKCFRSSPQSSSTQPHRRIERRYYVFRRTPRILLNLCLHSFCKSFGSCNLALTSSATEMRSLELAAVMLNVAEAWLMLA